MTVPRNGAAALAATLVAAGVKRLFTLSGNHIMPVFDACLDAGIELLHTRHEAAAVHMADAWARLTGEPGVALVTGGPGHANAVAALYTASMAESPVLLLSGHAPHAQLGMGAFQEMRQTDIAAPLTKAATLAASADSLPQDILEALRLARAGRPGPVHLSLPTDALEAACTLPLPQHVDITPDALPLSPESARAFLHALAQAQRPLILTGPASMRGADQAAATALEAACGIPVIGMQSPRGVADPALGAYAEMLAQADCILLLGKRLDFTLKFGTAPAIAADCTFMQIDAETEEFERSRRAVGARLTLTEQADHGSALAALRDASAGALTEHAAWTADVRAALAYRPAAWATAVARQPGRLHPYQALAPIQAMLDRHPDAVLVADGGEIGQWAQAILHAPDRVLNGVAGSIGAALPFAVAASLARPGAPVIAVLGDGTFGFHAAEIDTAVRYRLPFVLVVGNDARWNAEYQIQLREYGPDRTVGCELLPTRYDLVTQAFGGHGSLVTMSEAVTPALAQARGCGLPACVNIMIEGVPAPVVKR
ncbi:thiamine pyrophosphate-binding protein [Bordetella sp. N]|uniref:thiamine pyrophosphate-binding protein n=1 Tax=Bordetella sp. N TaxID=1746199 RepID=UPI0007089C0D|nr:thiamine pyrophosphate-binding protein [Bordetella sp. N]ALM84057.1 acetolactate synthase [Bordetella sp. N]